MSKQLKQIKTILSKYGINTTLLEELANITAKNPEVYFPFDTDGHTLHQVSPILLQLSKYPLKLKKAFKKLGLYNVMLTADKPDRYSYIAKNSEGLLTSVEILKSNVAACRLTAFGLALIDIIHNAELGSFTTLDNLSDPSIAVTPEFIELLKRMPAAEEGFEEVESIPNTAEASYTPFSPILNPANPDDDIIDGSFTVL